MTTIALVGTPFWSLSVTLNILNAGLIMYKLIVHRRGLREMGVEVDEFTAVIDILAESAALYAFTGVVYIFSILVGHPSCLVWAMMFGAAGVCLRYSVAPAFANACHSQYLCPMWILLRSASSVSHARQYDYQATPSSDLDSLDFAPNPALQANSTFSTAEDPLNISVGWDEGKAVRSYGSVAHSPQPVSTESSDPVRSFTSLTLRLPRHEYQQTLQNASPAVVSSYPRSSHCTPILTLLICHTVAIFYSIMYICINNCLA
jgi:hypothetical protein